MGPGGARTKPECFCCADQSKCSLEASTKVPGFQHLCFVWRCCTWFSNLVLTCGISWFYMGLPSGLQQLIILYFCPILSVFSLYLHFEPLINTEVICFGSDIPG